MTIQKFNVSIANSGTMTGEEVAQLIMNHIEGDAFMEVGLNAQSSTYVAPQTYYMLVDVRKAEDTGVENLLVIPVEYTEEENEEDAVASAVPHGYVVFDTNPCVECDYNDAVEEYASNLAELERSNNASAVEDSRLSDSWNYYEISRRGLDNIQMATHIIFEDECNNPLLRAYAVELGKADSVDDIIGVLDIDSDEYFKIKYDAYAFSTSGGLDYNYKGTYENREGEEIAFSFKSKFLFNNYVTMVAHAERLGKIPDEFNRSEMDVWQDW